MTGDHLVVLSDLAELQGRDRRRPRPEREAARRGGPGARSGERGGGRRPGPGRDPPEGRRRPDPSRAVTAGSASAMPASPCDGAGSWWSSRWSALLVALRRGMPAARGRRPSSRFRGLGHLGRRVRLRAARCSNDGSPPPVTPELGRRHGRARGPHALPAGREPGRRAGRTQLTDAEAACRPSSRRAHDHDLQVVAVVPARTGRRRPRRLRDAAAHPALRAGGEPSTASASTSSRTEVADVPTAQRPGRRPREAGAQARRRRHADRGDRLPGGAAGDAEHHALAGLPVPQLAPSVDVWMPMAYYTYRDGVGLRSAVTLHRRQRRACCARASATRTRRCT